MTDHAAVTCDTCLYLHPLNEPCLCNRCDYPHPLSEPCLFDGCINCMGTYAYGESTSPYCIDCADPDFIGPDDEEATS